ncbi:MAG: PQQ-binding-like beta-propeller repeat protein, partial [Fidelibacterota bacterium]
MKVWKNIFYFVISSLMLFYSCSKKIVIKGFDAESESITGDFGYTNFLKVSFPPPLKLKWKIKLPSFPGREFIFYQNSLIVSTLDGKIYAFSISDGKKIGQLDLDYEILFPGTIDYGVLYLGRSYGKTTLFSYSLRSSNFLWKKDLGSIEISPLQYRDKIIVVTTSGTVYSILKNTGEIVWKRKFNVQFHSTPLLKEHRLILGNDKGEVISMNVEHGDVEWRTGVKGSIFSGVSRGRNIYTGTTDGYFYSLEQDS